MITIIIIMITMIMNMIILIIAIMTTITAPACQDHAKLGAAVEGSLDRKASS